MGSADADGAARPPTLLSAPLTTALYFALFLAHAAGGAVRWVRRHALLSAAVAAGALFFYLAVVLPSPLQPAARAAADGASTGLYWVVLGVLSSVGFGTGLHTFVLYLGPHIAKTALAATTCGHTAFDVYGPAAFQCDPLPAAAAPASALALPAAVFAKVFWAASLWGLGTAIGELPPYFLARTARLAGQSLAEVDEDLQPGHWTSRVAERIVSSFGFWGILVFASIPNPLFDLAGVLCGHYLVPFSTFFAATALGKAVVKVSLQCCLVIAMFDSATIDRVLRWAAHVSPALAALAADSVEREKTKLRGGHVPAADGGSWLTVGNAWQAVLVCMLAYFAGSIVNALAQQELARRSHPPRRTRGGAAAAKQKEV